MIKKQVDKTNPSHVDEGTKIFRHSLLHVKLFFFFKRSDLTQLRIKRVNINITLTKENAQEIKNYYKC